MVKLFIGGFLPGTDEMSLVQLVAPYGDVATIKIVRDKVTRKSKGYAFIEMKEDAAGEEAVLALQGVTLQGRELNINLVKEPPVKSPAFRKPDQANGFPKLKRPRRPQA